MVDANEVLNKFGVTEAEVTEWAKDKNLPNNLSLRAMRYVIETKGIGATSEDGTLPVFGLFIPKELTLCKDLKEGISAKVKVYVAAKIRSTNYMGCAQHKNKLDEAGVCPKCETEVDPTEFIFEDWAIGDDSLPSDKSIVASFPPNVVSGGLQIENTWQTLVGSLEVTQRKGITQERFNVRKILQDEVDVPTSPAKPISPVNSPPIQPPKETTKQPPKKKPTTNKPPEQLTKEAVTALTNIIKAFGKVTTANVENWYNQNSGNIPIPLPELLTLAGAKTVDGNVTL